VNELKPLEDLKPCLETMNEGEVEYYIEKLRQSRVEEVQPVKRSKKTGAPLQPKKEKKP